jgi:hypothetical protein
MGNSQDKDIIKIGDTDNNSIARISNKQIAPVTDINKKQNVENQPNTPGLMPGSVELWNNNMCKCDNKTYGKKCKECRDLYEKRKYTKKCFEQ